MFYEDLDRIARNNFGLINSTDAALIFGRARRDRLVAKRQLIPVHKGVYRVAGVPRTFEQSCAAALMAAPEGSAISHLAALRLHRLWSGASSVHLSVERRRSNQLSEVIVHRSNFLPYDCAKLNELSVTSVARTLFDVASLISSKQLEQAIDAAVIAQSCSYRKMLNTVLAIGTRGHLNARRFVGIVQERLPIGEVKANEQELRIHKIIARAKLPKPVSQFRVWRSATRWYDIDIAWPEFKVAIEFDGFAAHGMSYKKFDLDRERNNFLRNKEKWEILQFTARMTNAAILEAILDAIHKQTSHG